MKPILMRIVAFLNARHYVANGERRSQIHGHSWQLQADFRVTERQGKHIGFDLLQGIITEVLRLYEDRVLNELPPFDTIQPLTENLAIYFFQQIAAAVGGCGVVLDKLLIWENPSKGIVITDSLTDYLDPAGCEDRSESSFRAAELTQAAAEVAAGEEQTAVREERDISDEEQAEKCIEAGKHEYVYNRSHYLAAAGFLTLCILTAYRRVVFVPPDLAFPWGSDTWGHLLKSEFLFNEISRGVLYPQLFPAWYNGMQPFRYWAPLSYYGIAFFRLITGNIFVAGNYYLAAAAIFGGVSCLGFARRIGMLPALLAGFLWAVWPDNVRVAFSEGNLPRVMTTALLPLLFLLYWSVLEEMRWSSILSTVLLMQAVILSHAMLGAVDCLCLLTFGVLLRAFRGCSPDGLRCGGLALAGGIASSGWWLLPSLQGGLAGMRDAAAGGIQFVPAAVSFNPWLRWSNPETFYWGVSLAVAFTYGLWHWRRQTPWAKSLLVLGAGLVFWTFPSLQAVHRLMPGSSLLWPLRFSTFASFSLLTGTFAVRPGGKEGQSGSDGGKGITAVSFLVVVFLCLALDSLTSIRLLAVTRPLPESIFRCAKDIAAETGWRVGTIDLSRLGSIPSYLFACEAGREQVFGWAWQGAATAPNIMLLNTAVTAGYYPFLFSRLQYLGATDLVVKDDIVTDPTDFNRAARAGGYRLVGAYNDVSYWRGQTQPYAVIKEYRALALGRYAAIFAMLLPQIDIGCGRRLDDYSLDELQPYPVLVLSGVEWQDRVAAEELVLAYAKAGGRVIVDLTGFPLDPYARQPRFLGVYGEPVTLQEKVSIHSRTEEIPLQPFAPSFSLWKCSMPQGLDKIDRYIDYYGVKGAVSGFKTVAGVKILFLGGNLAYHAFLTRDPAAVALLQEIVALPAAAESTRFLPFEAYQATSVGYIMQCVSREAADVVIPVAALDGMQVYVDGQPAAYRCFEQQILLPLSSGAHRIDLFLRETPVYRYGKWGTLLTLLGILLCAHIFRKKPPPERGERIWLGWSRRRSGERPSSFFG